MNDRTNGAPKPGPEQPTSPTASTPKGTPPAAHKGGSRAEERIAALDTSGAASAARWRSSRRSWLPRWRGPMRPRPAGSAPAPTSPT